MRKLCALLAVIITVSAFAAACKKKDSGDDANDIYLAGYQLTGEIDGGAYLADANLKSADITYQDTDAVMEFSFLSGSRMSGTAQESVALNTPPHKVYLLSSPARLVVEIDSLKYWDYIRTLELGSGFVTGSFQYTETASDANGNETSTAFICFQLDRDAAFWASASADKLTVKLRALKQEEPVETAAAVEDVTGGRTFYVVADAFSDYCDGTLSPRPDMTPTLANDNDTVVLISESFMSEALATAFMNDTLNNTAGAAAGQWSVVALKDNELPPMDEDTVYKEVYSTSAARENGEAYTPEVLIRDGFLLCATPDKSGYIYSKRITESNMGAEYTYEQVYITDGAGSSKNLLKFKFDTLEQAKYSPDGRKLAVLAREAESAHLYIFDVDTNELLTDLSEMGFGDMISAFTWDDTGSTIFAVGGSSAIQVHQYDFNVPEESRRHTLADKKSADEGSVAYASGEVYFVETDMSIGPMIYRVKPDGGIRKEFRAGSSFALSDNARYMAINASLGDFYSLSQDTAEKNTDRFEVYDMTTGEAALVTDEFSVYNYCWSNDSTQLYYFENRLAGDTSEVTTTGDEDTAAKEEQDPFPYTLWVFDVATGTSRAVCDLPYTAIFPSNNQGEVYLNYYDPETAGGIVRATYIISLAD